MPKFNALSQACQTQTILQLLKGPQKCLKVVNMGYYYKIRLLKMTLICFTTLWVLKMVLIIQNWEKNKWNKQNDLIEA